ncbi:MAG: hypothetical protein PHT64_01355 [Bacteroidales bacterium]|nr:hypothetical protein [Bacteroidales bacterium]MDD4030005.1 hypothetical protein [Bacteroidales bacterium]MDD5732427.1 hypothetical protein [Bacteroidales bacterium]
MLTEKDISLIQNKVDGTLTSREEDRFAALLQASPQAVDLYRKLLDVHQEINNSAARIPPVDITNRVMHRIEGKTVVRSKTVVRRLFSGKSKIFAFAASLLLFFVLGVLAAPYLIPSLRTLSQNQLTGTMVRQKPSSWKYSDKKIDVEVRQHQKTGLLIYWVSVLSADTVAVEFTPAGTFMTDNWLKIIDSDGLAFKVENQDYKLSYICKGNTVFALTDPPDRSTLTFSLEGEKAFQMKFPPTF